MKNHKGALSIEAAIVVPIFMLIILSISFFIRVVEVQETIHYAMSEAASVISHGAYLVTKTGAIDQQNQAYQQALSVEEAVASPVNEFYAATTMPTFSAQGTTLSAFDFNVTGSNIIEFASNWIQQVFDGKQRLEYFINGVMGFAGEILSASNTILGDGANLLQQYGPSSAIETINGYLAGNVAKALMGIYLEDEYLNGFGLDGEIDLSESEFMLNGKDIVLRANYSLAIPYAFGTLANIEMFDSIRIKAFVGNQNYKTEYSQADAYEEEDQEDDQTVYVTDHGSRYHMDPHCFCIDIHAYPILYGDINGSVHLCDTCSGGGQNILPTTVLYTTPADSSYHLDPNCYHIIRNPRAMSLSEAREAGYTPCGHCSVGN